MISVNNVDAGYDGRQVLKQITCTLNRAEMVALIGPNGAGKSTLLRTISGMLQPSAGEILLDDQNVTKLNESQRARKIAVVPQARNLPPAFSAREVVAMGRTPYLNWLGQLSQNDVDIVESVMRQTDTLELQDRLTSELSGGEQQRLLLARALAQETPYLLLDEPTSHLDLQFQVNLMQHIRALAHPQTQEVEPRGVLIAVHDLNLAREFADRVILLVRGEVLAAGKPREVLDPDLLSQVYHIPMALLQDSQNGRTAILPKI